ncbi:MAG: hypothetical protein FJX21_12860 [Alphaproteobacteria bacterium]|nr:hypothetical protein [Alphaproteobacteria bacterium]
MSETPRPGALERDFREVHAAEIAWINEGRGDGGRLKQSETGSPPPIQGAGLALSGGGIRSAAFCLGAMQALDVHLRGGPHAPDGIRFFDWMSTVSGGGYAGASVRLGMEQRNGEFPFAHAAGGKQDGPALGHVRNYSRYLAPRGGILEMLGSIAIVLRGLLVNLLVVGSAVLVLAALTGFLYPDQGFKAATGPWRVLGTSHFDVTLCLLGMLVAWMLGWAGWRFMRAGRGGPEMSAMALRVALWLICLTILLGFLQAQPHAASFVFDAFGKPSGEDGIANLLLIELPKIAAALGTVLALVSSVLGRAATGSGGGMESLARRYAARAGVWAVALIVPLCIWIAYLHATLWTDIGFQHRPATLAAVVSWYCGLPDASTALLQGARARALCNETYLVSRIFLVGGLAIFLLLLFLFHLEPNATSLHRLYRDRLSKAFLFGRLPDPAQAGDKQDPPQPASTALQDLKPRHGPLLLMNCALNIHASRTMNRRGRNADFFFFSPLWAGSAATGFLKVASWPTTGPGKCPDIGAAMAISGAAVSSNMGATMPRRMALTLAVLNLRLGYWMPNPAHVASRAMAATTVGRGATILRPRAAIDAVKVASAKGPDFFRYHPFFAEIFSKLDEDSDRIYLTDGGHIENLGVYELLRRRVRTIVVVDGEADGEMNFGSLVRLQRFARIDLGVTIDLPWQAIREATLALARGEPAPASAAHVAVGTIDYGDAKGTLVYVKSSLTGDENDYIRDYARRNPSFPHETTGDQFFSEEQFEVYRALGFHALNSAFTKPGMVASDLQLHGAAAFAALFRREVVVPPA